MYIETSSTLRGNNAKLQVSVPGNGTLGCLTFYYHMYGLTMGSLIVLSGNATVFKETGNHGNYWRNASITITSGQTVSLTGAVIFAYFTRNNKLSYFPAAENIVLIPKKLKS